MNSRTKRCPLCLSEWSRIDSSCLLNLRCRTARVPTYLGCYLCGLDYVNTDCLWNCTKQIPAVCVDSAYFTELTERLSTICAKQAVRAGEITRCSSQIDKGIFCRAACCGSSYLAVGPYSDVVCFRDCC